MLVILYLVVILSHFQDAPTCSAEKFYKCTDDYSKTPICVNRKDRNVFCEIPSLINGSSASTESSQKSCGRDQIQCLRRPYDCIPKTAQCDGKVDCKGGSDEMEMCESPRFFQCSVYRSTEWRPWNITFESPISEYCPHDDTSFDVALLQGFKCVPRPPSNDFIVAMSTIPRRVFIPQSYIHQEESVCRDQSDRCFDSSNRFRCSKCLRDGVIISKSQVCDGLFDCKDLSDECACPSPINAAFCDDVIDGAIDTSLICDGKVDFGDCMDELYCGVDRLKELPARCCSQLLETPNLPKQYANFNFEYCGKYSRSWNNTSSCHDDSKFSSRWRLVREPSDSPEDIYQSIFCTSNGTASRIQQSQLCNLHIDCDDRSDEMNCSLGTHFYCNEDSTEFIARDKVEDGTGDCTDFSDECLDGKTNLIDSEFLNVFIWLVGIVTVTANVAVLCDICMFKQSYTCKGCIQFVNSILVTNLAVSDLLMGVSLLIICVKSVQFRELYCTNEETWKSSLFCDAIGCLVVISSQSSLNCLTLLSAYRLYASMKPFEGNKMNFKLCYFLVFISWTIAVGFAVAPIIFDDSVTYMVEPNLFLPKRMYTSEELEMYNDINAKLLHLPVEPSQRLYVTSQDFQRDHPDRFVEIIGSYSSYSGLSICFPMFYFSDLDGSSKGIISLAIVCYDSVSLIFIGLSYLAIYVNSTNSTTSNNSIRRKKENFTLKTRIFYIVLTDICSWLPLLSIALVLYSGAEVDNAMLEWIIIILLPVNSSINPIIYSRIDRLLFQRLRKSILNMRRRNTS